MAELASYVRKTLSRRQMLAAGAAVAVASALPALAAPFFARNTAQAASSLALSVPNNGLFFPLPYGAKNSSHGLLCQPMAACPALFGHPLRTLAKHGFTVAEVKRHGASFNALPNGAHNFQLNGLSAFGFSGPAAQSPRLGLVNQWPMPTPGTLAPGAAFPTPWGTLLVAESDASPYFAAGTGSHYGFERTLPYFDTARDTLLPHRFGWIWEFDPYNPLLPPVKHTALGRFAHSITDLKLDTNGHVQLYSTSANGLRTRFISAQPFNPSRRSEHAKIFTNGTLYVARPTSNHWHRLQFGAQGLTPQHGFHSPSDIVIDAPIAAQTLLGLA